MCDIKYWDNFYSTNKLLNSPSDFCKFTLNYFKNNCTQSHKLIGVPNFTYDF